MLVGRLQITALRILGAVVLLFASLPQQVFAQEQTVQGETYFGTVRAREITSLSYGARGCITAVAENAKVAGSAEKGQLLVQLDDARSQLALRSAEGRLAELKAALEERGLAIVSAQSDERRRLQELDFVTEEFERSQVMLGRGLINETAMDVIERRFMDATFAAERSGETIATAEAAYRRAIIAVEIAELDARSAQITLDMFSLYAPIDGVLVGFESSLGDCVQEGALAARIYDPSQKSVDVFFPISRLSAPETRGLAVGSKVAVTRVNGARCDGVITRVDTEADPETQFVEATVDVSADCAPALFLNESVEGQAVAVE